MTYTPGSRGLPMACNGSAPANGTRSTRSPNTPTTSAKPGNSNGMTSASCSVPPILRAVSGSSVTTSPATCARRKIRGATSNPPCGWSIGRCRWWRPMQPDRLGNTGTTRAATASAKSIHLVRQRAIDTTALARQWKSSTPPAKVKSCAGTRSGNWSSMSIARATQRAFATTSAAIYRSSPTPSESALNLATTLKDACSAANCPTDALSNISGQLVGYTDPAGHTTLYQHNRRGQVRQRVDAHGRQIEFHYDAYGRLQTLTNENAEKYRFTWDQGDRLTQQQDLDGSARRYAYDALDNLAAVEYVPLNEASSIVHRLERDAVGRLLAKVTDDGRTEYAYDPLDQLTAVTFTGNDKTTQALAFAYDPLGQLLTEQSAAGSLNHHYDELGNLIQTQLPDGRWLNRLYYGSGHLHQLNLDGQVISDFERDRLHREVLRTQGQITTRSEYDRSGRLRARQRRHASQPSLMPAAAQKHFEYDPADNLIGRREDEHRELLHYDATGRIIASQDSPQGKRETFAYDAAANLLDGPQPGAGLVVHNKLLTYQDKRYRYDGFGRMIEKRSAARGVQHFAYDAEHRLIEVRSQKNGRETVVKMTYDPLGRRIAKTEHDSRGHALGETRFTWDGLRLLQEHRHSQTSLYLYEDDGYTPLARVDGTGEHQSVRYYHNDLNGLPEQLTEADGRTVWRARYQVWGNAVEEVREPYYIEEQNLRFQGQYLDREIGLHYNTFRFYDPDVGRFTTPDPIGLAGGLNLYAYGINPIAWIDPLGFAGCPVSKIIGNAKNGKVRRGKDYHGRLDSGLERHVLSSPQGIYQAKNGNLIFHNEGNIVVTHGKGGAQGNVITSYGPGGPRGESGAAIYGGKSTDPGLPITSDMILKGTIPRPNGGLIPPAIKMEGF